MAVWLVHLCQPAKLELLLRASVHELATAVMITLVTDHGVELQKLVAYRNLEFDGDILARYKLHGHRQANAILA